MSKKTTKRALAMSFVSVFLCVCMLVGTTFAWFTDKTSTAVNKIQSGTLDIVLEYESAPGVWANAENQTLEFKKAANAPQGEAVLWEPGCTYDLPTLRLRNAGNLALKYKLIINGVVGDAKLLEAIEWTAKIGNSDINLQDGFEWHLDANQTSSDITISGHMKETAGNEYQNLEITGIGVTVLATQKDAEFDSFDNTYDQFADYDGEISTAATLAAALAKGGTYKLTGDIVVDETVEIPANVSVNLDLGGKTITSSVTAIKNSGILNIVGGTMENTKTNGGAVINNAGTLTLDDVTINGAPIDATGYPAYAVITSGKLTVEDGTTIDTNRGAISMSDGAEVVINGGNLKVSDDADGRNMTLHTIYAYGYNSKLTINGGSFEQNHTSTGGASVICPAGATINVYGGDFRDAMDDSIWTSTGNFQNYMGYGDTLVKVYGGTYDDKTFYKWIADGYVFVENGDNTYTVVKGVVASTQDTLNNAISSAANGDTVVLSSGTYTLPTTTNKAVTISGTKDTVIDLSNGTGQMHNMEFVFDGVTIKGATENYKGIFHSKSVAYKNCTLTGLQFLYAETVTFENCDFDSEGREHSIWTYGSKNISFTDCDFTYGDRAVNVYLDNGTGSVNVSFDGCTFATTNASSKGAVEINSSVFPMGANVSFVDCTAPAYGTMVGISGWDNTNGATANVTVDGAAFTPTQWAK